MNHVASGFTPFLLAQKGDTNVENIIRGANDIVPFVAGGIGITSLIAHLPDLDLERIKLFWTLNVHDVGLAEDTLKRCPSLGPSANIFISRLDEKSAAESDLVIAQLRKWGAKVIDRRMVGSDVKGDLSLSSTWYLCTNTSLRKSLVEWLPGKKTVYEDFGY